jgi:hypothetical protein
MFIGISFSIAQIWQMITGGSPGPSSNFTLSDGDYLTLSDGSLLEISG